MRVFCGGTRAGLEPKLGVSLLQKKREERHLRTVLGPALQKKENRRRSSVDGCLDEGFLLGKGGGWGSGLGPKRGVFLLQKKREDRQLRTVLAHALQKKTEGTVLCAALQKKTEEGFALKKGFRNKFMARLLRA